VYFSIQKHLDANYSMRYYGIPFDGKPLVVYILFLLSWEVDDERYRKDISSLSRKSSRAASG
jgi:hypothetical protein